MRNLAIYGFVFLVLISSAAAINVENQTVFQPRNGATYLVIANSTATTIEVNATCVIVDGTALNGCPAAGQENVSFFTANLSISITSPTNNTEISGNTSINISVTDINNNGWITNVSLYNSDSSFNTTVYNESILLNTTGYLFDSTVFDDGTYTIRWTINNSFDEVFAEVNVSIDNAVAVRKEVFLDFTAFFNTTTSLNDVEVICIKVFSSICYNMTSDTWTDTK